MLTRTFIKNLITKAHPLRPVVLIGNKGLTPQVHQEVKAALVAHELIKVRVNAPTRELRKEMVAELVQQHQATMVQFIGHIVVLYRDNAEDK